MSFDVGYDEGKGAIRGEEKYGESFFIYFLGGG